MPRISSKITVEGWVSCKASILPKKIVLQYLQNCEKIENIVVDILADNLRYEQYEQQDTLVSESVNIELIGLASPYKLLCRYLSVNYIKQYVINAINIRGRETPNWVDINFVEYMKWLGLWELEVSNFNDLLYSIRSFVNTFNKNLIKAIKPGRTLCIDELINLWLGYKNKISGFRKIPRKPYPVGQEWKVVTNSSTNIIIQLESCEDKNIEKKGLF
ncbi:20645_t:CDS:2 [Racocetra persica]|uniref:20645_t:CDS:1 n=1 Tax=Racocetra persica TaxID=160502 RepID=A0ACA9NP26_9GLOM|nr:20645_t:CDS:2 [Racocetra persica]